ncbi:glycosyltransferase family 1 protein [Lapillicoccus sp.]|uniref:glycosyltransferase family 4 protein n=1 Tax=Lapillicoccus sp. TaxID=1909287 RepID=UPI003262E0ED
MGRRTGIGTYTANLLRHLTSDWEQDEVVATAFTFRGRQELATEVPPGIKVQTKAVPARALRAAWARVNVPVVEALCGRVDVFHATNFVLPPSRGAAGVVTIHDLAYLKFPETVSAASLAYRELVPKSLSRAAVILTPSRTVRDQLLDAYVVDAERVVVTPLGVDQAWFEVAKPSVEWRRQHGLPDEYLLAVGTLEPRKNLAALLAALRLLTQRQDHPPHLVLAGGKGWGPALDLAGLRTDKVTLTGHLPEADLRRLVAGASLLVFPSLDEGFGLPPLEALACGVSVLANDLPVTREVLGSCASYCDAGDPDQFAAAVLDAVGHPAATPAQRQERASGFSWTNCVRLTRQAYVRALDD